MMFLVLKFLFGVLIVGFGTWAGFGIWFQIKGLIGLFILGCWVLVSLVALYALWFQGFGSGWAWVYGLAVAVFICFWHFIPARLDRDWADELAHTVTGVQNGRVVTLHNVRDFNWNTGAQHWIERRFDLDQLQGLDVILSYWGNAKIAHAIISFRFNDVEPIAFSVEIRKEKGEEFSSVAGFFKSYEQAFIAANEADIVALRTNHRDPIEDVYLYPLNNSKDEVEALFLGYVNRGNDLATNPRWYHTITANCTTVIFDLVRSFRKDVKLDRRIILSGMLPDLFAERGVIDRPQPYGDYRGVAAITSKGQGAASRETYSAAIRK